MRFCVGGEYNQTCCLNVLLKSEKKMFPEWYFLCVLANTPPMRVICQLTRQVGEHGFWQSGFAKQRLLLLFLRISTPVTGRETERT